MHLDDETVAAAGGRGQCHGAHKARDAGGVTRVDDDGQVRQLLEHRHSRKVERVSRVVIVGADAALAEDNLLVAAGHDILCAHQKLLKGAGKTAL